MAYDIYQKDIRCYSNNDKLPDLLRSDAILGFPEATQNFTTVLIKAHYMLDTGEVRTYH